MYMYCSILGLKVCISQSSVYMCLCLSVFPSLGCMSLFSYLRSTMHVLPALLSVCVYIFLSLRSTNLCFHIFNLYVSIFAWISQTFLYVSLFPVFIFLCIYFPFFDLCVCILQSLVYICFYLSEFSSFLSTTLIFPTLHFVSVFLNLQSMCGSLPILSLQVWIFKSWSYYAYTSYSSTYVVVFPNFQLTCLCTSQSVVYMCLPLHPLYTRHTSYFSS